MFKAALLALALAGACTALAGADPSLIKLEDLARAPAVNAVAVSPDGARLAYIEMEAGRGVLVVRDLETGQTQRLYRNAERSINNVVWSADGRWLLTFQDAGGDEGYHLFRIDPTEPTAEPVDLTPFNGAQAELIRLPTSRPNMAIITLNSRDPELADAYALDIETGRLTETARNEIGFTELHADAEGRVLVGAVTQLDGKLDILARSDPSSLWRTIYTAPVDERLKLIALSPDGRDVIIRTNRDRSSERLLRMDLATGRSEELTAEGCGRFDEDAAVLDLQGQVALTTCVAENATVRAADRATSTQVEGVRRLVGADASLHLDSATPDLSTAVYFSDRSDRPGRYILYRNGEAKVLAEQRPWLSDAEFVPSTFHLVAARDGLQLPVYVTQPHPGSGPGPTVISLHGGPWSRDMGGFEPEVQLLANRGLNVLQVNFRGSTGFGRQHFEGGVRQFGAAMSDDVIDALDWAIAEGIADPERVCIMGGSYGGYAALVGLTRDAGRFKCGVDFAGPVDLITLVEAFPPSWRPFLPRSWYRFVGDPSVEADRLEMAARSPLPRAANIRVPLLIFQGANDPRVTQAQSDQIVCALRARNVPVDYLLAGNEGHSFGNEETGLAVNRAVEEFLGAQLGTPVQPGVENTVEAALRSLRAAGASIACDPQVAANISGSNAETP
ncbi:MAG: S9 family peptidase [Actinomycetota bacterium]|nr:S9 family peptidase [Actinomycetota bacterium]